MKWHAKLIMATDSRWWPFIVSSMLAWSWGVCSQLWDKWQEGIPFSGINTQPSKGRRQIHSFNNHATMSNAFLGRATTLSEGISGLFVVQPPARKLAFVQFMAKTVYSPKVIPRSCVIAFCNLWREYQYWLDMTKLY